MLELWNRPRAGELAPWVRVAVAVASVLGVLVVAASAAQLWKVEGAHTGFDRAWFHTAPPVYMVLALTLVFLPGGSVSRFVRLAVALPVLHAIAMLVALVWVPRLGMPMLGERTPMLDTVPPGVAFVGLLGLTIALAVTLGRRDWIHAFVTIALANLLLLGLWLPIAAGLWALPAMDRSGMVDESWPHAFALVANPPALLITVVMPPLVVASAYAAISLRRPELARRMRVPICALVILVFALAIFRRLDGSAGRFLIYDNFVHVLLAAVMVAIVATVTLALSTWLASRRASRRLAVERSRAGVIAGEDREVVACMQITSWLRGPRIWTRDFVARVGDLELVVPAGARLAAEVPLVSSVMRTGEAIAVLGRGDRVKLGGFVERELGEDPFRSTTVTVPGPAGIVIGGERETTPWQSMGLTAWRPSVAYLLILTAVGIPALAGLAGRG